MSNEVKSFEQRMKEHRMQYEQQRAGSPRKQGAAANQADQTYLDAMYMNEQENDGYITVLHQQPEATGVSAENEEDAIQVSAPAQNVPWQSIQEQRDPLRNIAETTSEYVSPQSSMPGMGSRPIPETLESPLYTPGFLRTQIGRLMRVEFLIGTTNLNDRTGKLVDVGVSYIVLQSLDGLSYTVCDIYSIKFITIINTTNSRDLLEII